MKIQAWENHQKLETEAEMRKIEVKVERMRGRVHDKLKNKLATARRKAKEKHAAAAEAKSVAFGHAFPPSLPTYL